MVPTRGGSQEDHDSLWRTAQHLKYNLAFASPTHHVHQHSLRHRATYGFSSTFGEQTGIRSPNCITCIKLTVRSRAPLVRRSTLKNNQSRRIIEQQSQQLYTLFGKAASEPNDATCLCFEINTCRHSEKDTAAKEAPHLTWSPTSYFRSFYKFSSDGDA